MLVRHRLRHISFIIVNFDIDHSSKLKSLQLGCLKNTISMKREIAAKFFPIEHCYPESFDRDEDLLVDGISKWKTLKSLCLQWVDGLQTST